MKKRNLKKWVVLLLALVLAAGPLPVQAAKPTFRLDVQAPATVAPGETFDVVITVKDIQAELVSVEFYLDFDERLVSGVITQPGKDMDALMTVMPMYIMEVQGIQLELPRYEQICGYNAKEGIYLCRFMDLLHYPGAKPGVKYPGLIKDGELVITIPFRVSDTAEDGAVLSFSMLEDTVSGTTKAELARTWGTANGVKTTVSDPNRISLTGSITRGSTQGKTKVELWKKGEKKAAYTAEASGDTYELRRVTPGSYTLTASAPSHVSRSYEITLGDQTLTRDLRLCLKGDANGDDKVNTKDAELVYRHLLGKGKITDTYALSCANVTEDTLNIADIAAIYAHSKGTAKLF
jgi:hypothetical protein